LASKKAHLEQLQAETEKPGFWDDHDTAQKHMQKVSQARAAVEPWEALLTQMGDLVALADLAIEADDESLEREILAELKSGEQRLVDLEFQTILSGRYDPNNAIMSINAGAGGTESCDWAEMLLRMYGYWAESHKYTFEVVSYVEVIRPGCGT